VDIPYSLISMPEVQQVGPNQFCDFMTLTWTMKWMAYCRNCV